MNPYFKAAAVAALTLISTAASAGLYVGGSVGQTDVDLDGYDEATSYAITAGFDISRYFAIEASYIDLGDADDDLFPRWTVSADGYNAALVGRLPITTQLAAFAKVGAFIWEAELEEAGYGRLDSDDGTDYSAAVGLSLALTQNLDITAEYLTIDLDVARINNVSAGIRLFF